ncbi:DNA binding protein [Actinidia rufa]|uniref:DNA binding protein n=1 Tax=Actinidia rufa TaxID=165716 RepID=A0A7J0GUU0_9ERIC|nr:DNA binding protein [Actinidia rufa]
MKVCIPRAGDLFNSMYAVKGGWVGQTFALTKSNESGGKKSRIRLSKKERKAMVESFIKKYQKLNNGNFPSLSLTHKEVGGSFYTVRELVREVIQENRVLGPAKLDVEEQSRDGFLEQYPLGSISIEPETDLSSSSGSPVTTHILPNHHQETSEELVSNSSVQSPEPKQRLDGGQIIDGSGTDLSSSNKSPIREHILPNPHQDTREELVSSSCVQSLEPEQRFDERQIINGSSQAVEKNEEYGKEIYTESQTGERVELEEKIADLEVSRVKVTHVAADIMVETFPLTSASKTTYGLDVKYSEPSDLTGTLVEKEIGKVETEASNNDSVVDGINFSESSSDVGNRKAVTKIAVPLLEKSCGLVDEKPVGNLQVPLETNDCTDSEVKDASPAGIEHHKYTEYAWESMSSYEARVCAQIVLRYCFILPENYHIIELDRALSKLGSQVLEVWARGVNLAATFNASIAAFLRERLATRCYFLLFTFISFCSGSKVQAIFALEGTLTQRLDGTITSSSGEQSISTKQIGGKSNHDIDNVVSAPVGSNPTLDRMNLQSWEKTSTKSAKPEANPLLAFFKSFIAAFVKFWSE